MAPESILYFIASIPPEPLQSELTALKQELARRYDTTKALRIVPHITFKAPFRLLRGQGESLRQWFSALRLQQVRFDVRFSGFGAFRGRSSPVFYLQPLPDPALHALHTGLHTALRQADLPISFQPNEAAFHPHLTLAYRDLSHAAFERLWQEYGSRRFERGYTLHELTLLEHNGHRWQPVGATPLRSNQS